MSGAKQIINKTPSVTKQILKMKLGLTKASLIKLIDSGDLLRAADEGGGSAPSFV